jgi:hypothetical protein
MSGVPVNESIDPTAYVRQAMQNASPQRYSRVTNLFSQQDVGLLTGFGR